MGISHNWLKFSILQGYHRKPYRGQGRQHKPLYQHSVIESVVPIPKKGGGNCQSHCRPISLFCVLSKLLEKHIYKIILQQLNYPLSSHQWGFLPKRSTVTALLGISHNWFQSLNAGKEVCAVFLDLCKAFDSVPHLLLLHKLRDLGISHTILQWLFSYLRSRKQCVLLNGQQSSMRHVTSGVPQGSVLGPLLFLFYINDLASVQLTQGTQIVLYADDILLYKEIASQSDYCSLQCNITSVSQWVKSNHLTLNINKCKYMVISKLVSRRIPLPGPLTLSGHDLERVSSYRYLGVTPSQSLKWSDHITDICRKARRVLGIIYHQYNPFLSLTALRQL